MAQGKYEVAQDLLTGSLGIFQQVYGPIHKDIAETCSLLARIVREKNKKAAIQYQERAVIICERVLGLDHYMTAQAYISLSSLLSGTKPENNVILGYANRALYLNLILSESNNLSVIDSIIHMGKILQELKESKYAREYLKKALQLSDVTYGPFNIHSAELCHLLSICWLAEDRSESLKYETKNLEIREKIFGKEHFKSIEARAWIAHIINNSNVQLNPKKKHPVHKNKKESRQGTDISKEINEDLASRPVADLLKFIQGSENLHSRNSESAQQVSTPSLSPENQPTTPETSSAQVHSKPHHNAKPKPGRGGKHKNNPKKRHQKK